MPPADSEAIHDLSHFASVLQALDDAGFEYAVIGGAAISAYARSVAIDITTRDLDLYVSQAVLDEILDWAPGHGMVIVKRPQPRSVPVAFLEAGGLEINLLTASSGLPTPELVIRGARSVLFAASKVEALLADPFDLLRNKLAVRREKDQPHIRFLQSFIEEEIVEAFRSELEPRERLAPARRYLEILGSPSLPPKLGERLLELARLPSDFRFLANRLKDPGQLDRLANLSAGDPEMASEVARIRSKKL
jgi:predicted nucleotidyltransferase